MANERENVVLGNICGRDESPTRKQKQKKERTSKVRDPAMGETSEGKTYKPPHNRLAMVRKVMGLLQAV